MKTGSIAVIGPCIVIVAGVTYAFMRDTNRAKRIVPDTGPAVAAKSDGVGRVVQVDEIAKGPGVFQNEFVLRGAVAGIRKTEGVFAVIDAREFKLCGVLTYANNTIPVKFTGDLPAPRSIVEITGRVVKDKKGLVIAARRVEIVK